MKRKDWISLIALLAIISIVVLGEFISSLGNYAVTAGNLWYIVPMIILLVGAVLMGQRKGNHTKLFKWLSWISYSLSMVFLFCSVFSFMHFFNVQDSSKRDMLIENTTLVKNDISSMLKAYKEGVTKRRQDYATQLFTAIELNDDAVLNKVSPRHSKWIPADARTFSGDWERLKMLPTYEAHKTSFDSISPIIDQSIIGNFNIFTAGGTFNELKDLYNRHKQNLSQVYSTLNPIEEINNRDYNLSDEYINHEHIWKDTQHYFVKKEFSIVGFIIFLLLAFFASLTFLCVKDESIRKPTARTDVQNVYKAGHKL